MCIILGEPQGIKPAAAPDVENPFAAKRVGIEYMVPDLPYPLAIPEQLGLTVRRVIVERE
jgi:hypothetical protein